jgi:hypothetical protein
MPQLAETLMLLKVFLVQTPSPNCRERLISSADHASPENFAGWQGLVVAGLE